LATILINPFISCGARLPVYLLLAGAFFGARASTVIFLLYTLSILIAIFSAKLLRSTVLRGSPAPFIMELPPYHVPTLKNSLLHTWDKGSQYLKKAGTVILGAAIIIWALTAFNMSGYIDETTRDIDTGELVLAEGEFSGQGWFLVPEDGEGEFTGTLLENLSLQREGGLEDYVAGEELENLSLREGEELLGRGNFTGNCEFTSQLDGSSYTGSNFRTEESFAADIGRFFEPATAPLGFNWKMNTALVFGFAAKELVVGSLGVLYGVGDDDAQLTQTLEEDDDFSPLVAFSLMVFVLTYVPCVATVAVIYKETKSLKWTSFSVAFNMGMAWLLAFLVYQVGGLLGY
jgi:ferrous iron transport protein B